MKILMTKEQIGTLLDRSGLVGWALNVNGLNRANRWGKMVDPGNGRTFDRGDFEDFEFYAIQRAKWYAHLWAPISNPSMFAPASAVKARAEHCGYVSAGDVVLACLLQGIRVEPRGEVDARSGRPRGGDYVGLPMAAARGTYDEAIPVLVDDYRAWAEEEAARNRARRLVDDAACSILRLRPDRVASADL